MLGGRLMGRAADRSSRRLMAVASATGNTVIGVVLLLAGAVAGLLSGVSPWWPLTFLTLLGVAGAILGLRLPEVSRS
ncbi:hypothetical protein [Kytococcus sp. Marseille-QA3725]